MAVRKKLSVERQPEGRCEPCHGVADGDTPSARPRARKTPATPPIAGLSSAVLQLPRRLAQPLVSLPVVAAPSDPRLSASLPAPRQHTAQRASRLPMGKHPTVRERFGELREALAEGFEIVQPIFARPLWTVPDDSATAFNFVLTRERTTRLVIVPEGRTIQRFIRERHLVVDYRR